MIRWPFITRKEHEAKVAELEQRLADVERHFVTKRDPETGKVLETLADRQQRKFKPTRVTWQQTRRFLEATDGGRNLGKPA
jgi:hypothetical protein